MDIAPVNDSPPPAMDASTDNETIIDAHPYPHPPSSPAINDTSTSTIAPAAGLLALAGIHVLVACTGSVACIRVPQICYLLQCSGAKVSVIATRNARFFLRESQQEQRERQRQHKHNHQHDYEHGHEHGHDHDQLEQEQGALPAGVKLWTDEDEWALWKNLGDPVLHIELRKQADVLLVAPMSANTMAKIATGICDDLVSCVIRAWPVGDHARARALKEEQHGVQLPLVGGITDSATASGSGTAIGKSAADSSSPPLQPQRDNATRSTRTSRPKPVVFAPAMNTYMWENPLTTKHIDILQNQLGMLMVQPVVKKLACGDMGVGALATPQDIHDAVVEALYG